MLRRSKRLRMNNPKNVDPLAIGVHSDLHELLLQHFDPADVLISSETSTKWFGFIGQSKKCMKQISLGLDNWWTTETTEDMVRTMRVIKKTTRKYQNVCVNSNDDPDVSKRAYQLLKKVAPSLVDLRFINAEMNVKVANFAFPRLERLQFINNVGEIDDLLLGGSTQLHELNLKHHYWCEPKPVMNCLKNNANLKILKLWDTGVGKLFKDYEPNSFQFKLNRFATGADGVVTREAEENFIQFLDTQSDHIEAIRFRSGIDGVNATIINKVFQMASLKTIHLDGIGDLKGLNLPVNPRLNELRLSWNVDTLEKVTPFLRAAPKVETLFLRKVNKEILEFVAKNLPDLKTLYYTRADACMGCFKKFLSSSEDTNKDIRLVTREWY